MFADFFTCFAAFHLGEKTQDVYFHLLLESYDLDIIKALNKINFTNCAN